MKSDHIAHSVEIDKSEIDEGDGLLVLGSVPHVFGRGHHEDFFVKGVGLVIGGQSWGGELEELVTLVTEGKADTGEDEFSVVR